MDYKDSITALRSAVSLIEQLMCATENLREMVRERDEVIELLNAKIRELEETKDVVTEQTVITQEVTDWTKNKACRDAVLRAYGMSGE